jgi:hypothetical protein
VDQETDNSSYDVELLQEALQEALKNTVRSLESRGKDVRLTVVGGIIATLVIKNRSATHDVDFFTINNPKGEVKELLEISAEVGRALEMSPEWLNNATQLFLKPHLAKDLEDAAEHVIFKEPGLTLVAAPYRYLISSKIDRITGGGNVPHGISDAAGFLHELRKEEELGPISKEDFVDWAKLYNTKSNTPALEAVARYYTEHYGEEGLALDAEL